MRLTQAITISANPHQIGGVDVRGPCAESPFQQRRCWLLSALPCSITERYQVSGHLNLRSTHHS